MRRLVKGLVVGPLDKNAGELWLCCPTLYSRALKAMYCEQTGYSRVYPANLKEKGRRGKMPAIAHFRPHETQAGTERDLVEYMRRVYKANGWEKYAKFNGQGGVNTPYVLFFESEPETRPSTPPARVRSRDDRRDAVYVLAFAGLSELFFTESQRECYHRPFELEDGAQGTLLETTFEWKGDRWAYHVPNQERESSGRGAKGMEIQGL